MLIQKEKERKRKTGTATLKNTEALQMNGQVKSGLTYLLHSLLDAFILRDRDI